jgi:hypothetical protein
MITFYRQHTGYGKLTPVFLLDLHTAAMEEAAQQDVQL